MTDLSALLVGLALAILLVLLVPWMVTAVSRTWLENRRHQPKPEAFCRNLCRVRVILGVLLGLAIGALGYGCRTLFDLAFTSAPPCVGILLIVLGLLLLAVTMLVWKVIECGAYPGHLPSLWGRGMAAPSPGAAPPTLGALTPYVLLVLLAVILLVLLLRSTGLGIGAVFASSCGRMVFLVALVAIAFLIVRALERYLCERHDPDPCCHETVRTWMLIAVVLMVLALLMVRLCGDDLRTGDFDLAMVGVYWDGKYPDDHGAHLRWAFRYGLPFPENGCDLNRRDADAGAWTVLNTEGRIHPAQVWDGTVPGPAVWRGRGKDRVPTAVHARYEGSNVENFTLLREVLDRPPYDPLHYVEGSDTPFLSQTDADAFAASAAEPAAQWQLEPMTLLLTMALHPEVARLLGLYYIDTTARPDQAYDYRVICYWSDRTRSYTVRDLSLATTQNLAPTAMERADAFPTVTRDLPDGSVWPTEALVQLRWVPPTPHPDQALSAADGIRPVMYRVRRQDVGPHDNPGTPLADAYEPLDQITDDGAFEPADPVVVTPQETEGGPDQWPEYFAYDYWVDYRSYAYQVVGIDIFGRDSPPSDPIVVSVLDAIGPTPPVNIEARLYQRLDPAVDRLLSSERDALFPPASTHDLAIRVSWLWPHALRDRHPDLKEFRVHYQFNGYEAFVDPANVAVWRDAAQWEGVLTTEPQANAQPSVPARFEDPDNPGVLLVPGSDYYETTITAIPAAAVDPITADDDDPVRYGLITVAAVDHDPFNNVGPAGSPVAVMNRDFVPPDPPPAPHLTVAPGAPDDAGNAHATLRVAGADARYQYQFLRLRDRTLLTFGSAGPLPAPCVADPDPLILDLQQRAHTNSDRYELMSATPVDASNPAGNWVADFTDQIDATISQRFLYAARAIDRAGNISPPSCPSHEVLSRDRMPPRAPVVTAAHGAEGAIVLTWAANPELDLDRYEVYRTADRDRLNSKRKLTLVLAADLSGAPRPPTPTAPPAAVQNVTPGDVRLSWTDGNVTGGRQYFYRLVAVDIADNASELSDPVSGRPIDTTPPAAPTWAATDPVQRLANNSIRLTWIVDPAEPDAVFQLQRQDVGGSPTWRSVTGWISTATYDDGTVRAGRPYRYRIRAMDPTGNKGPWSVEQTTP